MCFKKLFHLSGKKNNLVPATGAPDAQAQAILSKLPGKEQQIAVENIDRVTNLIQKDAFKIMEDLKKELGRQPTQMEFLQAAMRPMLSKAVNNKDLVNAVESRLSDNKKQLPDANQNT